jgi:UDP-N-acetylglucosamine 3-dehydrogenase
MAETHARAYKNIASAELVGVMDIREEAARRVTVACGGERYTDFERMLQETKPDVVDVSTPTPFHLDYVRRALAAKPRGIVCEKPMGRTVAECREMIEVCRNAGVPLFVAQVLRWFPEFAEARRQVLAGAVGNPAVIRTRRGGPFPRGWDNWYGKTAMSGGVLLDLIIHDFDWLLWTFGPVQRVFAKGLAARPDAPSEVTRDYALVTLRFKSGASAHVEGTWADPGGFKANFEIAGTDGLLESSFTMPAMPPFVTALESADSARQAVPTPESPLTVSPYQQELQHFLDCLEAGREPDVRPQEAMAAVVISEAAAESVRTGRVVTIG